MKAMVLAAGVGSRLDPLTARVPKPLVPVANRPVMELILELLKRHGISQVVSNLHHLPERLIEYFGDGSRLGMSLTFYRETVLSGDAGGVRACRAFLEDDTFLVIMGDLLTDVDVTGLVSAHKKKGALATIALKRVDDVSQFGVALTNEDGFITGFQEKPQPGEALSNLASTGIYIFEPEIFRHIPAEGEYGFGRQLFPQLVNKGAPVLGVEIASYWSDVGTISQYRLSNFDCLEGRIEVEIPGQRCAQGWLAEGALIESGCRIEGLLLVGRHSQVKAKVKIKGRVIIGDDCVVGEAACLEDSVIWSGSSIEAGAILKNCVLGSGCLVRNGSMHTDKAPLSVPSTSACR